MSFAPNRVFSSRSAFDLDENALTRALAKKRAEGPVLDLTVSNPTTASLDAELSETARLALASPAVLRYEPLPFGLPRTRELVAAAYAERGLSVHPSRIVCTASTSEAYAWLFSLLADPGDEVLVPEPSYPLFSYLARHTSVSPVGYPLRYDGAWHLDLPEIRRLSGPRTRAIVLVSPNNPTGSYTRRDELEALLDLGVPLVADEVFARYPLGEGPSANALLSAVTATRGLVFAMSGLSKEAALPQMKLGWIVVAGDPELAEAALARLEVTADTFLSVGAPVQHAAEALFADSARLREAIGRRTTRNLTTLDAALGSGSAISRLRLEGGWYATLRLPAVLDDDQWALELLEKDAVYAHPGSFFDFAEGPHLVVSLLPEEPVFVEGIRRLCACVERALR